MSEEKLIPVIAQDIRNNNVLMCAYANDESLELTKKTGFMHYWSRSRNKIWKKGETSGHYQKVYELLYDCDRDTILARVEQEGPACHTGSYSCFSDASLGQADIISQLWRVFEDRKSNPAEKPYTCKLLRDENKMLKKLAEESAEVIMAAKEEDRAQIVYETGDLLYHLMVMLFSKDITMDEVYSELQRRRK